MGENLDRRLPQSTHDPCSFIDFNSVASFFLSPVTPSEISAIIGGLKVSKTYIDSISVSIMKLTSDKLSIPISKLVNKSFQCAAFPDPYKIATVTPILKTGPTNDLKNYRPISILPIYSKILEKCICMRLVSYLTKHKILSPSQFGFQTGLSTTDAILKFIEKIYASLNSKFHSISIFLDLKNAFDTVNHKILLSKLNCYGIRGNINALFKNYLQNRFQRVRIGGTFSEMKSINVGLPQGSCLSPILFLIYINDLANISNQYSTILFADDATFTFCDANFDFLCDRVNQELSKIVEWANCNRLTINTKKTVAVVFSNRAFSFNSISLCINNEPLDVKTEHKFLGITFDNKLCFQSHINFLCQKISKSIGILYRIRKFLCLNQKFQTITVWYIHIFFTQILFGEELLLPLCHH